FGPANLNVGESATFTVTYEITQDDINNGGVYNIALATGNDPNDDPVTVDSNDPNPLDPTDPNYDPACPDCTFTELEQESGIDLTKSGLYVDFDNDGNVNVGDVIEYTFTVTNTGNTTLTDVVVTDPLLGNDPLFGPATLDAGESSTFTVTYGITQSDIDNGGVYNIALATGNDSNDDPVTDDSNDPNPLDPTDPNYDPACPDCTFTELDANPELTLWKSGVYVDENGDGKLNIGDVVEYTFVVENTGNTTITDIYVTDPMVTVNGGPITLAPGEVDSTTFTATYYLTHADIYEGVVYNLATVEGEDPSGTPVYDDSQDPDPLDPTSPYYDEDCPDCTVTPLPKDDFEIIKVPNAFTPDGDGQNDTWVIEGIELYPNSVLIVYNRWGNIVYEATGYLNDWNGTSNNNLNVGGNELPTGTYYYVLDTKEDKPGVIKGFVYIQR
ncbi:MAG TPA: gliding motility-associated C-terminal domain-containing protein, partial [Brumimicrobium sp.]|nr:gliding motility-associated C-terminal domain-containing protein [Brumimicrobium sp.]